MNYTGERPTIECGTEASQMRYRSVIPFCLNKTVYDFGCGIGHGSFLLSGYAKKIVGYDPCQEAIEEAKNLFIKNNLTFTNINSTDHFDIISSVECIEHIEKEKLEELLKTFIRQSNEIIITTPNGDFYPYHPLIKEDRRGFHVWHYTHKELKDLFSKYYDFVEIYGSVKDPAILPFIGYTIFAKLGTPYDFRRIQSI